MRPEEVIQTKQQLHAYCMQAIQQRIARIQTAIAEAQQAANEETKSSSGDKYETTRAMMHLEIEKNSIQLQEALKQLHVLTKIPTDQSYDTVENGSLVITNQGFFYLAISIGRIAVEGKPYLCISAASPIGLQFMKQRAGHQFNFQGKAYSIEAVL